MSAQAFLLNLSSSHYNWLVEFARQNCVRPTDDWLPWYGDSFFLGWLPQSTADQLVFFLPRIAVSNKALIWKTADLNSMQRSQELQKFLDGQLQRGFLRGWRNEYFNFWIQPGAPPPQEDMPWLCVERAGFRHLGLMSHAVHVNAFCSNGRMWSGQRANDKATDPGMLDNLAAGGLTAGEDVLTTAQRELHEEAGVVLNSQFKLQSAGFVRTQRVEPEGWHDETLCVYNLDMPLSFQPVNNDGEVQAFHCFEPDEVVLRMQIGLFTADAIWALCQGLGLVSSIQKNA